MPNINFNPNWIKQKMDEEAIKFAEQFAKEISDVNDNGEPKRTIDYVPLTTSQLRKFFGAVKNMQLQVESKPSSFDKTDLLMFKPKLAYAVGRAKKGNERKELGIEAFEKTVSKAIDQVTSKETFGNFINFFEAIVAYQKRYGREK